jgi:hypothetical protein
LSNYSDEDGSIGFVGPTALIFAELVLMAVEIPATHQFSLLGLPLSEKLFSYILALQLIMGRSSNAWIQALVGLLVGFCYQKNILGIADFRLPSVITAPIIKAASFITDIKPSTAASIPNNRNRQGPQQPNALPAAAAANNNVPNIAQRRTSNPQTQQPPLLAPPQAAPRQARAEDPRVQQLLAMGFDRRDVITALELSNLDVDMALNLLLDDQRRRQ